MTYRSLFLTIVVAAALFGAAVAQNADTPAPTTEDPTPAAPAAAQSNPIALRTEIYIVSLVTLDDGSREERFTAATSAIPGQVIEYRIFASNTGETTLPAGRIQVLGPVQDGMEFVAGSATPNSDRILTEYSADGLEFGTPPILVGSGDDRHVVEPEDYRAVRWTLLVPMEPGQEEPFFYRVTLL